MIVAVDDSLVTYSLKHATLIGNADEVNYICNRIAEAAPGLPKSVVQQSLQMIDDFLKLEPGYLRYAPFNRLQEVMQLRLGEFAQ